MNENKLIRLVANIMTNALKIDFILLKKDLNNLKERVKIYEGLNQPNYKYFKNHLFFLFSEYEYENKISFITEEGNRLRIKYKNEKQPFLFYYFEIMSIQPMGDSAVFNSIYQTWKKINEKVFEKSLEEITLEDRMEYIVKYDESWSHFSNKNNQNGENRRKDGQMYG